MANIPLNLQFLKEMQVKNRNITINISIDPPISGWGGFDEWQIDEVPDSADFQTALHNFIVTWSKANKLDGGWTGVE